MELSQDFIIDMLINGGGYLAAALIGIVVYSLFFGKKEKKVKPAKVHQPDPVDTTEREKTSNPEQMIQRKMEFIKFGEQHFDKDKTEKPAQPVNNRVNELRRPDRKEVISLARKMLDSGATHENIKKILPVSEAELALLSLNNK